ncbi:CPBP family intramembrane glutamic endopeptidase [Ornithinimicrobium sp. LYQ92]|uniref:CPBP family intramembrane glutamic endopeptidase n=1 Tax=Serinicoccus sp. LYQ92 TaxID=3378798 RepID=UPI003854F298
MNPVSELNAFLRAALVTPVPRDHRDPPAVLRRRRIVTVLTLLVGAALLGWSLRLEPGNPYFYLGTTALAAAWVVGALLSGPLYLGRGHTRRGTSYARPIVQSFALGLLLLAIFLAGALLMVRVPSLAGPVNELLDHARFASLPLVLLITAVNGVAEELFFRGALYAAIPQRWTVLATTGVYALTTVVSGVLMLVFAALVIGLVCGLQRRVTGGILGPAITHVTWSGGMLLLLPPLLQIVS